VIKNAEHLAGALALDLGIEVTWHPAPDADLVIFETTKGRRSAVGMSDIYYLPDMKPEERANLFGRMRRDLLGKRAK
jgi:hypothetical protein